jgi:ABC-type antimicrobial peptide transport system permease subunit
MWSMLVAVRTRSAIPVDVLPDVRAVVASIDRDIPLGDPQPMTSRIGSSVTVERFQTSVMSTFGALALLLACLGVYAIRSEAVASRRREVGIRMALGATRAQVVGLMLSQGGRVVAVGLFIGVVVALGVGRVIEQWLFDTPYTDPGGLAAAAAVIAVSALAASWLPARRAAGADPVAALRAE